jgi:hypothetical protein
VISTDWSRRTALARRTRTKAVLDIQIKRHAAISGESEEVLGAAYDAEAEALDMLVWTGPATISGIVALLELWPELQGARIDDDQAGAITTSIICDWRHSAGSGRQLLRPVWFLASARG